MTYGVLWQWLVKSGDAAVENLLAQNCAFLLDEFSGVAGLGDDEDLKGDPQLPEIALLLVRMIEKNSKV